MTEEKAAFAGDKKFGRSLLAGPEDRFKKWLLPMVPSWCETYHLTATTVVWGLGVVLFSAIARHNIHFLWGASFMIFMQYVTDLLDGAIGRQRDTGLIKWGYYMDHFLDYFFLCCILVGYSFLIQDHYKYILFFVLAMFGSFMVNSFLSFAATNEFRISYLGIGPTEVRIVFIAVNTALIIMESTQYASAKMVIVQALPYVLWFATFGLFVTVFRTQKAIWDLDMRIKNPDHPEREAIDAKVLLKMPGLRRARKRHIFGVLASFLLAAGAFVAMVMRVAYPHHRVLAAGVYVLNWVLLTLSVRRYRKYLHDHEVVVRKGLLVSAPYVAVAVVLLLVGYTAYVLVPVERSLLTTMTGSDIREMLDEDRGTMTILRNNGQSTLSAVSSSGYFDRGVDALSPTERSAARELWRDCTLTWLEFDVFKERYKGFYQVDYVAKPELHADSFFLAFSGLTSQLRSALIMLEMLSANETLATYLNEGASDYGLPADTLFTMKRWMTHPDTLLRLNVGSVYLPLVRKDMTIPERDIVALEEDLADVRRRLGKKPAILIDNPLDLFEKRAFAAWYPIQKGIAVQMSAMRTTQRDYFIDPAQLTKVRSRLKPGDLLLERRNWHMTNIGIPGFWPHVALFIGTLEAMDEFFAGAPQLGGLKASAYLEKNYPEAYKILRKPDDKGYERCIIESKRSGVILTSIEVSGNADYLAAMRPRLSPKEKFDVMVAAFAHLGKPYDFNFDFSTDQALVCSELIYKSFAAATDQLDLSPVSMSGRLLLPPNGIAMKFAKEFNSDERQLDFVLFLDGSEAEQRAIEKTVDDFLATWNRPKWDIAQK
jgi:phosphatidylglycerophosphate synthase